MTVNEIIELLDKEDNKYGCATGKERELNLSINGDFIGTITSAKLDGWGDGLITDVTLEVEVSRIEYHDDEIIAKAIDEFAEKLSLEISESIIWDMLATMSKNGSLSDTSDEIVDYVIDTSKKIAEQMKAGVNNE